MNELIKNFSESAPYAMVGTVLAAIVGYLQYRLVSKERRHRDELVGKRQKELRKHQKELREMLAIKDRRIDQLHEEIAHLQQRLERQGETAND